MTALLDARVLDGHGRAHRLAELVGGSPCLLLYLRHWGCVECSLLWSEIGPRLPDIHDLGLTVVAIGSGPPTSIPIYVERYRLSARVQVVTDPTLRAHAAAGLHRSVWAGLQPRTLRTMVLGLVNGRRTRFLEGGDPWQQSGAVLVDARGEVRWTHASTHVGDHVQGGSLMVNVARVVKEGATWTT